MENNMLNDKLCDIEKRPKGEVSIYEVQNGENILLEKTTNLVVYQGRSWLMQRAFNQNHPRDVSNSKDNYISWFGLGIGGATVNLLSPTSPQLTDTDLYRPIVINSSREEMANGGYLHPFDSVEYFEDTQSGCSPLIGKITTTIGETDANGPFGSTGDGAFYDLNEAGLYVSDSDKKDDRGDPTSSSIKLFARVTFSTIRKYIDRQLVFVWRIYF